MRKSKTLARLRNNEPVRICGLAHFIPHYTRQAAHYGFDCIWLDNEHRAMSTREVEAILAYTHLADIDCMVRPPTTEKTRLYRYLEDGATGLMIPHVSTPEDAERLVQAVKFPPLGNRGLDGAGLDSDFLLHDSDTYVAHARQETFLVVQIETPEAVENADAIAAIEGVEGLFVGPADLGLRIKDPRVSITLEEGIATVAAAAKAHGKAWGCPTRSREQVQQLYEQGAQLVAFGGDISAVIRMLQQHSEQLEEIFKRGR